MRSIKCHQPVFLLGVSAKVNRRVSVTTESASVRRSVASCVEVSRAWSMPSRLVKISVKTHAALRNADPTLRYWSPICGSLELILAAILSAGLIANPKRAASCHGAGTVEVLKVRAGFATLRRRVRPLGYHCLGGDEQSSDRGRTLQR